MIKKRGFLACLVLHVLAATALPADKPGLGNPFFAFDNGTGRGQVPVDEQAQMLKELGYAGPIGLQCYAIKGDVRENLTRSMAAWRKCSARLAAGAN